jgi:hypothetical protein
MGFRFQKRIRIFKGLTLNLSKSGSSWTVGGKGASINVRGDKVTGNAGIPGTGISYRERLDTVPPEAGPGKSGRGLSTVVWILILVAVLGFVFGR